VKFSVLLRGCVCPRLAFGNGHGSGERSCLTQSDDRPSYGRAVDSSSQDSAADGFSGSARAVRSAATSIVTRMSAVLRKGDGCAVGSNDCSSAKAAVGVLHHQRPQ